MVDDTVADAVEYAYLFRLFSRKFANTVPFIYSRVYFSLNLKEVIVWLLLKFNIIASTCNYQYSDNDRNLSCLFIQHQLCVGGFQSGT